MGLQNDNVFVVFSVALLYEPTGGEHVAFWMFLWLKDVHVSPHLTQQSDPPRILKNLVFNL